MAGEGERTGPQGPPCCANDDGVPLDTLHPATIDIIRGAIERALRRQRKSNGTSNDVNDCSL